MDGVVKTRDLFLHSPIIVREFGVRCFARCIWRTVVLHRIVTFLECI